MPLTVEELNSITQEDLIEGWARYEHLAFMRYCWQKPVDFKIGQHTIAFCENIDRAVKRFREGQSTFILGLCCFGHGKSDIISNYFPAHFIGEFPDKDILVTSYSSDKAGDFSIFGRRLVASEQYENLYPDIQLDPQEQNIGQWGIARHFGKITFTGLDGAVTGKHPSLIIVDDYIKNRMEAESATTRDSLWEAFTNNIMTRRTDPCIVIVLCTPWHKDDISGRIQKEMERDSKFPRFEIVKFPAMSDKYPSGYLFPEMYSQDWYATQQQTLGSYGTASLMQCDPMNRSGHLLRTDKVKFYNDLSDLPYKDIQFKRAWDLASSVKQTNKSDPDFTVGIKGSVVYIPSAIKGVEIPILIIDDVIRGQWEATQRQQIILNTAIADGEIEQGIEAFAAYKDAYTTLAGLLDGIRQVTKMLLPGDKKIKADPLVPIFEAGNVWVRKAPWNQPYLQVLNEFDSGSHDDDVDGTSVLYGMFKQESLPMVA
jgi:predicted phage terminase large subunit-like protein